MNKYIKLLVSVLFIFIIMLTFGLTRFYFDVSKNTGTFEEPVEIIKYIASDDSGNKIFQSDNNLLGVIGSNDRIIVSPQWNSLKFAENGLCIATRSINSRMLTGCIDYEENVVVPFVYEKIETLNAENEVFYLAKVKSDGKYVLYNKYFQPQINETWDSVKAEDKEIEFLSNENTYIYSLTDSGPVFKKAVVYEHTQDTDLCLTLSSKLMLSKLSPKMLEIALKNFGAYVSYAFKGDFNQVTKTADNPNQAAFMLFEPQSSVYFGASPKKVSNIAVYNLKSSDGTQYLWVSAKVTVNVGYNEGDEIRETERDYVLRTKFRYNNSTISMIAGNIDDMTFIPDPPAEETTVENGDIKTD